MRSEVIVVAPCSTEQAHFFLRFQEASYTLGIIMMFFTEQYSVYEYIKTRIIRDNKVIFLKRNDCEWNGVIPDLSMNLEVLTGAYNYHEAQMVYKGVRNICKGIFSQNVRCVFLWNGCKVSDHAVKDAAHSCGIDMLFFEISNIKGKLFVDPEGTNANSFLYRNPQILKHYEYDREKYMAWKELYVSDKLKNSIIPQAKGKSYKVAGKELALNFWGLLIHRGVVSPKIPLLKLWRRLIHENRVQGEICDKKAYGRYIFFPLQVSSDTQILINGNVSLLEAIEKALVIAKRADKYLLIKPHPAERDLAQLSEIRRCLSTYDKIAFTNNNTFELIRQSDLVVTINSTVGLESRILEHPVKIFGRALYENLSNDQIGSYIMNYLFNIDYWAQKDITRQELEDILKRSKLISLGKDMEIC